MALLVTVFEYVRAHAWRCEYLLVMKFAGEPAGEPPACAFVSAAGIYSGFHGSAGMSQWRSLTYVWARFHSFGHIEEQREGSYVTLKLHRGQLAGCDYKGRAVRCRLVFEGSFMDMPHYDRFIDLFLDQQRRTLRRGRQRAIEYDQFVWL